MPIGDFGVGAAWGPESGVGNRECGHSRGEMRPLATETCGRMRRLMASQPATAKAGHFI